MPKRKVRFMGLLTKTDSSILGVKLEHGFKIEKIGGRELIDLIIKLEDIPEFLGRRRVDDKGYLNREEGDAYIISNLIDGIESTKPGEIDNKNFNVIDRYEIIHGKYLDEKLTLMRLFKEGHLFMPERYYFFEDDESAIYLVRTGMGKTAMGEDFMKGTTYSLEKSELQDLQTFIQSTKFPFLNPSLRLAHQNFEMAYSIYHKDLSFLALMISMESLFNPGGSELTYRISRNTAVLIGKDKDDSRNIFRKMKKLYGKRCDIVHQGKPNAVTEDDVKDLRDYSIRSIKEFYNIGETKDEILELLNSCGFGDRSWLQEKPLN
jgi:hypothetical protein